MYFDESKRKKNATILQGEILLKTDNLTDNAKLFLNQTLSECIFCTKVKSGCRYRNMKWHKKAIHRKSIIEMAKDIYYISSVLYWNEVWNTFI